MKIENDELVSRISFEVVKDVAPDELDLFDDIKSAFLENPKQRPVGSRGHCGRGA